jgi:hypothetical protein
MGTLLSVILMVVVVVGLRWLTRRRTAARRASLVDIASQLGLRVDKRDALGTAVPNVSTIGATPARPAPSRPLADGLTAAWGARVELHGEWNGREVSIGALPARRYRLAVAVRSTLPRELGLHVSGKNGPVVAPSDTRRRMTDDKELDRVAFIYAKDVAGATALLERPAVRGALMEVLASDKTVVVSDDWVYVTPYRDDLSDASAARAALDTVARLADALDGALAQS